MDVSVIVPVFNEAEAIELVYDALSEALAPLPILAEMVFVDDGSSDQSYPTLEKLALNDARVHVLRLRRNYGQTAALMAGFQHASGKVIIAMDGDGQNDPSDIPHLLQKLDEGYDVVSGWRREREDRMWSRRMPSVVANRLISRLLGVKLHDYGCTLKAYRREVIEDVRLYGEMHRFIPIFASWEGARVTELVVKHHPRRFGRSKYGLGRILRVLLDLLTLIFIDRALDRPMQFFGKIGVFTLLAAFAVFAWALGLRFTGVSLILTPLPLLAATLSLSGILFLLLGIVAEVMTRTYFEARGKAPYKIKSIIQPAVSRDRIGTTARW